MVADDVSNRVRTERRLDLLFWAAILLVMCRPRACQEGDVPIGVAPPPSQWAPCACGLPPIRVSLAADERGELPPYGVRVGDRTLPDLAAMQREIVSILGGWNAFYMSDYEVVIRADPNLRYEHALRAVTAVSGRRVNGDIERLVRTVRFSDARDLEAWPAETEITFNKYDDDWEALGDSEGSPIW